MFVCPLRRIYPAYLPVLPGPSGLSALFLALLTHLVGLVNLKLYKSITSNSVAVFEAQRFFVSE